MSTLAGRPLSPLSTLVELRRTVRDGGGGQKSDLSARDKDTRAELIRKNRALQVEYLHQEVEHKRANREAHATIGRLETIVDELGAEARSRLPPLHIIASV